MLQIDSLIDVVDELSKVRRDIDALKVRESELRGQLIEASEKYDDQEIVGSVVYAMIDKLFQKRVDWWKVARNAGISRQRIRANTNLIEYQKVRMVSPLNGVADQ